MAEGYRQRLLMLRVKARLTKKETGEEQVVVPQYHLQKDAKKYTINDDNNEHAKIYSCSQINAHTATITLKITNKKHFTSLLIALFILFI